MLSADALTGALSLAQRNAASCTTFCRLYCSVEDGRMLVGHNGLGTGDTDAQTIYAPELLSLTDEKLAVVLAAWLVAIHRREPFDLNAAR